MTMPAFRITALLALLVAAGCTCEGGGDPDAGRDAGGADGGGAQDAGLPDAGAPDAGRVDAGTDGGGIQVRLQTVVPVRGPAAGGTRVTLTGRGFVQGFAQLGDDVDAQTAILFGSNTAVEFTVIDDDTIEVMVPPGLPGARDVVVQNPNGEATCTGCFTYFTPVTAVALTPDASPLAGGVAVTLTGTGFGDGTTVLVGARAAVDTRLVDEGTLTFFSPPGAAPGLVDVTVFNQNGAATLRRRFEYFQVPAATAVVPPVGPAAGGTTVRVVGAGLAGAAGVSFGGQPGALLGTEGPDVLLVTTPPGTAGTAVEVAVAHPRGDVALAGAFAYVDPALRDPSLLLVSPARGPLAGGNPVVLAGTGLDHPGTQVRFGALDVPAIILDAFRLEVLAPAGAAAGPVDVQVRNDRGGALLPAAYRYERLLRVDAILPGTGPVAGGLPITVTGAGFEAGVDLRIGALAATDLVVVDAGTLTATLPPGSPGPNDVVVGLGSGPERLEAVLAGGFVYEDALSIAQVSPVRGAQAGGTLVTVTGTGFGPGAQVRFGDSPGRVRERLGRNVLTVYTPRGAPGLVDVQVLAGDDQAALPKAFQYYDPTNLRGGASGGPMGGTLNVTVLDVYAGIGVPQTHVILGAEPATPFQGLTDERGQITFSDPTLVKAQTVTASRQGYEAVTVARVDTRDLTIYLTPTEGEAGPPPTFPPPAFIGGAGPDGSLGRVCGFKLPPDRVLASNELEEARIFVASTSVTGLPPFRRAPYFQSVTQDCGTFSLPSRSGRVAIYAFYGVKATSTDASGQVIETFEPILMGITRAVEVPAVNPPICTPNKACPGGFTCGKAAFDPENPQDFAFCLCDSAAACTAGEICNLGGACQLPVNADVVLSMHMDLNVPVRIVNPPQSAGGSLHVAYSYLELGGEGTLYIGEAMSMEDTFEFPHHPRLPGDGFVFLNMATSGGGYPLSLYYRRQIGDLAAGVDIGPMQPFTRFLSPTPGAALSGGRLQWAYDGTPIPDVVMIFVEEPGFIPKPLWTLILPGSETQVAIPPAVLETLRQSPALSLTLMTALSPRFDFDHFSYGQLGLSAWNSFTQDFTSFTIP